MAKIYDFKAEKKKRKVDTSKQYQINSDRFFEAYMNMKYSDDDGVNAQIEFSISNNAPPRG